MMGRLPFRSEQVTLPEHATDRDAPTIPPSGSRLPIAERLVLRDLGRMSVERQAEVCVIVTGLSQLSIEDVHLVRTLVERLASPRSEGGAMIAILRRARESFYWFDWLWMLVHAGRRCPRA